MVGAPARQGEREWATRTALLIAGATVVRLLFVSTTDIANGEAYYYVWSRFPSLSYYDHPPLVGWMPWLTTRVSPGSLAARSGPLVCAPLAPLWILGLLMLERMREHDEPWRPLLAGGVAGLAFLAKYSGVLLLGVGFLYVCLSPRGRRWLRRRSL